MFRDEYSGGSPELRVPLDRRVLVFFAPGCRYSQSARDDLDRRGVRYEAFDVAADGEAMTRMLEFAGVRRVPVIVRGDRVTVGFGGSTQV